jgi:hypothetical protein
MHVNIHWGAVGELLNIENFYALREVRSIIEKGRNHENAKPVSGHSFAMPRKAMNAVCVGLSTTCAKRHQTDGPTTDHAITFNMDHSSGAAYVDTKLSQ